MTAARVSVVIPCYNVAPWIAQTIESVRAQHHREIELIVVNDGSTDGTGALLDRLSEQVPMRLVHQHNRGQTAALNRGLAEASGDYVQYLDGDDLLHPAKIEAQLARMEGAGPRAVASCRWARFRVTPADARWTPERCWRDANPVDWLSDAWHLGSPMMFPALWLLPRAVVERAGPWREDLTLNNDAEYFVRALLACDRVCFVPEAECYYRSGLHGNLSARRDRKSLESNFRVIEACEAHLAPVLAHEPLRRGLSLGWQRFAHGIYPDAPDLADESMRRAAALHPAMLAPEGGWRYRLLSRLVGWRRARLLQRRSGRR